MPNSLKFKPFELYNTQDKEIINIALENIKYQQKKFKFEDSGFKPRKKYSLSENFEIKSINIIKYKKYKKKGKYVIPCTIIGA